MEQIPLNDALYSSFLDQPDLSITELAKIIDYSPPPQQHKHFENSFSANSIHHSNHTRLPKLSKLSTVSSTTIEAATENRIEQIFKEDVFTADEFQHYFRDTLTQIADAVNLSAVRLLGNEAQSLPHQALLKKKKPRYIRKNPFPRIMKNDFRKDFVVMFRNIMNSADQSVYHSFYTKYTNPDCEFFIHNSSLSKVRAAAVLQHYKGVQQIVDEIAHRTLSLPDYIITIHKACIIQKEDLVGSKVVMQTEGKSTQVLKPAPSSLSQLENFCSCDEDDRKRITEVKDWIEFNAKDAIPFFRTASTSDEPVAEEEEDHPENTPSPFTSTSTESLSTAAALPSCSPTKLVILEEMRQAGLNIVLQELVQYMLEQGHNTPNATTLKEVVTRTNSFLNNPANVNANTTKSNAFNPLPSHKLEALRQLQVLRGLLSSTGGLQTHVHALLVAGMMETVRVNAPFLPISRFATTPAAGTTKLPNNDNNSKTTTPVTTSSSSSSLMSPEVKSTPPAVPSAVALMDIEILIDQMELLYQKFQNDDNVNHSHCDPIAKRQKKMNSSSSATSKLSDNSKPQHFLKFDHSTNFARCTICGKKKLPHTKVLQALMKPLFMEVSFNSIVTFYLDTNNYAYRYEQIIPYQEHTFGIIFDFNSYQ